MIHIRKVLCLFIVASCAASASADFQQSIRPLLEKHCTACHGPKKQEGDLRFDGLTGNLSAHPTESETWAAILEQLETGAMPPEDRPRPKTDEVLRLTSWIKQNVREAEIAFARKMRFPENGNRVPHEKLFDPQTAEQAPKIAASPARFWRILPHTYNQRQRVMGAWRHERPVAPAPFGLYVKHELKNYSSLYTIESSEAEAVANNARTILTFATRSAFDFRFPHDAYKKFQKEHGTTRQEIEKNPELSRKWAAEMERMREEQRARDAHRPANPRSKLNVLAWRKEPPSDEDLQQVVTELFRIWLGRPPSDKEMTARVSYVQTKIKQFGNRQGLIYGLVPVLIHPESVFAFEFGRSQAVGEPTILRPIELADALTRALDDEATGETQFHKLAHAGKLATREDIHAALTAKNARPLAQANTVKRFFEEFFAYPVSDEVFKCAKDIDHEMGRTKGVERNPYFAGWRSGKDKQMPNVTAAASLVVDEVLKADRQVLQQLLTYTVLYPGSTEVHWRWRNERAIASKENYIKQLEEKVAMLRKQGDSAEEIAKVREQIEKTKNHGELRQARENLAWLIIATCPTAPVSCKPVRGSWRCPPTWITTPSTAANGFASGCWAKAFPEVPIGVDAALPNAPDKTLRQKMEKTRQAECWRCHRLMDPLGLPFERYDHFGSYRELDKDKPVDTSGEIIDSGDQSIDGPVSGPDELVKKLATSERVEQSFVRHAFRFWMGRNETLDDARTIQEAYQAYKESDGSMHALLLSLLTSDAFLYRTGALPAGPIVNPSTENNSSNKEQRMD